MQLKAELGEILTIQVTRTPAERAVADAEEDVWRFSDVIGNPNFTRESCRNSAPSSIVSSRRKVRSSILPRDYWKRPRPRLYSDLVKPIVALSKSGAYPSGHTTVGTLMGIVLADMVPEKKAELMARAWEYDHKRLVGGIHYPSDIEAGRIAGTVIAQTICTHDDYKVEYEAAKEERRNVLGLPHI